LESIILSGDKKTGVSVMQLVRDMDAGPVFAQSEVELSGRETKQELADKLLDIGSAMVIDLLPGILDGSVVALPQDNSRATYDELITKEQGVLDWTKPAQQLEREVRAFAQWPQSRTELAGKDVVITHASIVDSPTATPGTVHVLDKQLIVSCGDQALRIEKLKPAGKAEMTAQAFLAGYKQFLN
jgi:methionyl-tRNA formyltransferase